MTDRVHPETTSSAFPNSSGEIPKQPSHPASEKPVPPPGTYVIQIPKDQVYRVPPPENAARFQQFASLKSRRRCSCCRCLCWFLIIVAVLAVLVGITAGILYLVFRPEAPKYAVEDVAIRGVNLTSPSASSTISPEIDVAVRAENPNDKIGIYYERESSVEVYYSDVRLCDGVLPVFYQPSNNVTVMKTRLVGSGIELTETVHRSLSSEQSSGKVPLELKVRAPVRIKVGSVKTWTITFKVDCDVTVDKLTPEARIVSHKCDYGVDLW